MVLIMSFVEMGYAHHDGFGLRPLHKVFVEEEEPRTIRKTRTEANDIQPLIDTDGKISVVDCHRVLPFVLVGVNQLGKLFRECGLPEAGRLCKEGSSSGWFRDQPTFAGLSMFGVFPKGQEWVRQFEKNG